MVILRITNATSSTTNTVQIHGSNNTYSAFDAGAGLNIGAVGPVGAGNLNVSGKITSVAITNSGNIETATLDSTGNTTVKNLLMVTGGSPMLVNNASALVSSVTLGGNDTSMTLTFTTGAATQQANSNYFTINLTTANPTGNPVIVTQGNMGTNSVSGIQDWFGRFTVYTTSSSILVYSMGVAPNSSATISVSLHVDRP
jgi:hypothetical protein